MGVNFLKKNLQAYGFLTPFLLFVTILYILPAILTVIMSFTSLDTGFVWEINGFNNYIKIFKDPNTMVIIKNTIIFVSVSIVITITLDLFLAIMTTYFIKSEKLGSFFKAILMIPMITPAVVYSVLWIWILDAGENGFLNRFYAQLFGGDPVNWIATNPMLVVIIATILVSIAYGTIVFSSAVKSIPENQFKAAKIDGASDFEIVKSIILPNLKFHIQFIALWETLGLLTNYTTILLITNGGPGNQSEVWALSAYHKAFIDGNYGYGAAISVMLIIVVVILLIFINLLANRNKAGEVHE